LFAYIGASAAGYPLSKVIEGYQWNGFYGLLVILSVVLVVLLFIAMQLQSAKAKNCRKTV
ncbi:MFS transporter family glucose-6-phosphate receptor UhpC, partial [Citrobacter portucalensis]